MRVLPDHSVPLRIAILLVSLVQLASGCTSISSGEFYYSSTKDVTASGLLIEAEYHPDGTKKFVHVEVGNVMTETEIEFIVAAAIKAALLAAGVPIP